MGYLLAALLGGFLFFNTQATPEKAAAVMETTLQQRFPGAHVDAQVEGKRGRDIIKGHFKRVQIKMDNFTTGRSTSVSAANPSATTPPDIRAVPKVKSVGLVSSLEADLRNFSFGDLRINSLNINFQDIAFDWKVLKKDGRIDLLSCGPASAHLSLTSTALEVLLRGRLADISEARLSLEGGKLHLSGKRNLPLIDVPVPFTLTGSLEARNGGEVWLTQPSLKMSGVPVASPIAGAFLRNINPLYTFDRDHQFPFHVQISDIQSRDGALELTGQLQFVPAEAMKSR